MKSLRSFFPVLIIASLPRLHLPHYSDDPHPLTIRFHNVVGSRPLRLDDDTYTNHSGESFHILQCKYYISNIRIRDDKKEDQLLLQPHLVDQADSASLELHLQTTIATPREIQFTIGVDSSYN